jgi:hypothetical protein
MTTITKLMDNYFEKELPQSLGLNRNINLKKEVTYQKKFDLTDDDGTSILKNFETGKASYINSLEFCLYILHFENYKKQINNCAILRDEKITRMCDYFIIDTKNKVCILNEISSGKDFENLGKPIEDFVGGKSEKVQDQLLHSLKTLKKCDTLWSIISKAEERVCLFSYKILEESNNLIKDITGAFNRPLKVEEELSNETGIKYSNKNIEDLGFEYRRIGYTPFKIS